MDRRSCSGEGWDERQALKHWAEISGPSALSWELRWFVLNEIRLRDPEEVARWQQQLSRLFSHVLAHAMPMEELRLPRFKDSLFQSRNAEEALLVALDACARVTGKVSSIPQPDPTSFGTWLETDSGPAVSPPAQALYCLSRLDLSNANLRTADLYAADLDSTILSNSDLSGANLIGASLRQANLADATLTDADARHANFAGANLRYAIADEVDFDLASFKGAQLEGLILSGDYCLSAGTVAPNPARPRKRRHFRIPKLRQRVYAKSTFS